MAIMSVDSTTGLAITANGAIAVLANAIDKAIDEFKISFKGFTFSFPHFL
ncbi:hypothetical protein [Paenibacillus sp. LjRoot56]